MNLFVCGATNLDLNMLRRLRRRHRGFGDTFYIDEVFVTIGGKQRYLWWAVDQEGLPRERSECCGYGEVVDVFLQARRDGKAAKRFFRRLINKHQGEPRMIVTDKLRSYDVAHRELIPDVIHDKTQYANNRAELSHQPTRVRERLRPDDEWSNSIYSTKLIWQYPVLGIDIVKNSVQLHWADHADKAVMKKRLPRQELRRV